MSTSSKVFVGGLAWETNNDALRAAFEKFGAVEDCYVISDRETGRSRGFGFVTFAESKSAEDAVEGMKDQELDGRSIRVDMANDRPPRQEGGFRDRPPRDSGYGGGRGGDRRGDDRSGGSGGRYGSSSRYDRDDRSGGRDGRDDRRDDRRRDDRGSSRGDRYERTERSERRDE
ncbi:hypothetical protein PhCBS80983_g03148 [Powellomyces hirtus]|uniref:RRM domain-containing protein n=1 Tax=Powellomyces hirtus TaxID=109895 RepID=A0A507E308_9FUNG|nr:hypothetical protein PhCBS80983_g03148 [Powellomyces hirtus]